MSKVEITVNKTKPRKVVAYRGRMSDAIYVNCGGKAIRFDPNGEVKVVEETSGSPRFYETLYEGDVTITFTP